MRIGDRLIKASVSNKDGVAAFTIKDSGSYVFYISCTGYQSQTTEMMALRSALNSLKVMLHPGAAGSANEEIERAGSGG